MVLAEPHVPSHRVNLDAHYRGTNNPKNKLKTDYGSVTWGISN